MPVVEATKYHYGKFPPQNIVKNALWDLSSQARTELGRYDGLLSAIDNAEVLLSPLFTQEAVMSSRIEGTQSSLSDVLEYEANENIAKFSNEEKEDIKEVINYRMAIEQAIRAMERLPLSQRILKQSHKILMRGVRGKNKSPGNYRRVPNWIGQHGEEMDSARFIPIDSNHIPEAMSQWEKFIHDDSDGLDILVKAAVLHAEFEALHPFLDGNGRLGRMLIPLYLWDKKIIQQPAFYMSAYFEREREQYYDRLLGVSRGDDWTSWCAFFLKGVIAEAKNNLSKAQEILDLYRKLKTDLPTITHSQYGIVALDYIFSTPVINSSRFIRDFNIPKPTAQRLLRVFSKQTILFTVKGSGRRPNVYLFKDLQNIVEGQEIF